MSPRLISLHATWRNQTARWGLSGEWAHTVHQPLTSAASSTNAYSNFRPWVSSVSTDVRKFALRFSGAAKGLGYNDAALNDLFNTLAHRVRSRARFSPGAHRVRSRARSSPGAHRVRSSPGAHRVCSRVCPAPVDQRVNSRACSAPGAHRARSRACSAPGAHRVAPLKWWFSAPSWWPPALSVPPWHPCPFLSPGPLPLHGPGPPSLPLIRLQPTPPPPRNVLVLVCGASGIRSLKWGLCHGPAGVPWLATRCIFVFVWEHGLLFVIGARCSPVYCLTPPFCLPACLPACFSPSGWFLFVFVSFYYQKYIFSFHSYYLYSFYHLSPRLISLHATWQYCQEGIKKQVWNGICLLHYILCDIQGQKENKCVRGKNMEHGQQNGKNERFWDVHFWNAVSCARCCKTREASTAVKHVHKMHVYIEKKWKTSTTSRSTAACLIFHVCI